eukprot:g1019.t1
MQWFHILRPHHVLKRSFSILAKEEVFKSTSVIDRRITVWDEIAARNAADIEERKKMSRTFRIQVGNFSETFEGIAGVDSITSLLGQKIGGALVAKVNNELYDLNVPLHLSPDDTNYVELFDSSSVEGKSTLWHSAAHCLGQALEHYYPDGEVQLTHGPPLVNLSTGEIDGMGGFFYEMKLANNERVSSTMFPKLEELIHSTCKGKGEKFERLELTYNDAKRMFSDNPFKLEILSNLKENEVITAYRNGNFIDLCRGPHISHTGKIGAVALTRCSGTHWQSNDVVIDEKDIFLQRIYGIAFRKPKELKVWKKAEEELKQRDHRMIGLKQELFAFHKSSPGCVFFLPHGTRIFQRLLSFLRKEYRERGYDEVMTPLMFNPNLWKQSGHMDHYGDNMFSVAPGTGTAIEKFSNNSNLNEDVGFMNLKPMNCPAHCLIYGLESTRSYRSLPLRLADFTAVHRNELSGAISGLTRLRHFHQDDAHIFCTREQVESEIIGCLDMVEKVYGLLGFTLDLKLSTRPVKALSIKDEVVGSDEEWEMAESELAKALTKKFGKDNWTIDEGEGAFYGPKIDVIVTDALNRKHQCATIQLDFQLPERFDLKYKDKNNFIHRPVMVHRAILGSVERFIAMALEQTSGKLPLFLSPRQCAILPVSSEKHGEYAKEIATVLGRKNIFVKVNGTATLNKRIRQMQLEKFNYILVVGDEEVKNWKPSESESILDSFVNVRTRDGEVVGPKKVQDLINEIELEMETPSPFLEH